MQFDLSRKKKTLTPNPTQDRLSAKDCFMASSKWLVKACQAVDEISAEIALNKAAKYENMAHDGRK